MGRYYIKAPASVAADLQLTAVRNRLPDGSYLLWQADLGPAYQMRQRALQLGCLLLTPEQARDEQQGRACAELPGDRKPETSENTDNSDNTDNTDNTEENRGETPESGEGGDV